MPIHSVWTLCSNGSKANEVAPQTESQSGAETASRSSARTAAYLNGRQKKLSFGVELGMISNTSISLEGSAASVSAEDKAESLGVLGRRWVRSGQGNPEKP